MLQEVSNINLERPDKYPDIRGWTMLVVSSEYQIDDVLRKIRQVWYVAATWGRYFDEELEAWPSIEEMIQALPEWFLDGVKNDHSLIDHWGDHLHEREWGWWSSKLIGNGIKIDLEVGGLPMSTYCVRLVINRAGGKLIYDDLWIDSDKAMMHLKKW